MITTTSNLNLPLLMPSQAQKHVTHNEALVLVDALVQLRIQSRSDAPPASIEGDVHIVDNSPTGDWQGESGKLAIGVGGGWAFVAPRTGWRAWLEAEQRYMRWNDGEWVEDDGQLRQTPVVEGLGIGTPSDAANQFAMKGRNALIQAATVEEGGDGDMRVKVGKEAAANTASLLFQTGYSGRAEIGISGTDHLSFKVSETGSEWREALVVDNKTGAVALPASNFLSNFALNLFSDSGRFGSGTGVVTGNFAFPAYLTVYGGGTAAALAKFIHNNTDHGGTSGVLHADVKALIEKIREPAFRRYGLEFWVAEITQGATTIAATSNGVTYYLSLYTSDGPRPPALSFHCYLRAVDAPIMVPLETGQTIRRNGTRIFESCVITPSDGWTSVMITDRIANPRAGDGYRPRIFTVYARATGNRWRIACPTLMSGTTLVDQNVGIIAGADNWKA